MADRQSKAHSTAGSTFTVGSNMTNNKAREVGQVSGEPLTLTSPGEGLVQAASAVLVAAATGTGRFVTIKVPVDADTGIRINFGAAADGTDYLIGPGETETFPTEQAIHAIRAGAADVTVQLLTGVA